MSAAPLLPDVVVVGSTKRCTSSVVSNVALDVASSVRNDCTSAADTAVSSICTTCELHSNQPLAAIWSLPLLLLPLELLLLLPLELLLLLLPLELMLLPLLVLLLLLLLRVRMNSETLLMESRKG